MKRSMLQFVAIAIGVVSAMALYSFMRRLDLNSDRVKANTIGAIESIEGQLERRAAGTVTTEKITSPRTLLHQDLLVTQKNSSVIIRFLKTQTVLKLQESSRFIAESDSSRADSVIATILDGEVAVLSEGAKERFHLFRQGQEIPLSQAGVKSMPEVVLSLPTPTPAPGTSPQPSPTQAPLVIVATKAAETPSPKSSSSEGGQENSNVLTNEDIVRVLRGQSGFFQRCYLNFIHREQAGNDGKTAAQTGAIVLGFVIQPAGKVTDAKIVRSDFADQTLKECVREVVDRTAFKGFTGKPVPVVEFPISLQ